MSCAQHTPGPWDYFVGNANGRGLIRIEQHGTGVHIASMPRGPVSEANARLQAAAPEVLEALRIAIAALRDHDIDESMAGEFEILTDAYSKATGAP